MTDISLDNNVYILGAGFSTHAGLPVISNFLNMMRDSTDWLERHNRMTELEAVEEVFRFRLSASAAAYRTKLNAENIEELFSLASAHGDQELDFSIPSAIASTLEFCGRSEPKAVMLTNSPGYPPDWLAYERTWRIAPFYEFAAQLMAGKFQMNWKGKNTVISFNYDTLVDDAFRSLDIDFNYGIDDDLVSYEQIVPPNYKDAGVSLLKLHGSVNWAAPERAADKVRIYESYKKVRGNGLRPLLVPPTWRKTFGGALDQVWSNAVQSIKTATRIVLIGFSVPRTDVHFKYLISAGLQDNISLRSFTIVDPYPEKVRKNISAILRRELETDGILRYATKGVWDYFCSRQEMLDINRIDENFPIGGDLT